MGAISKMFIIDALNIIRHNPSLRSLEDAEGSRIVEEHFIKMCQKGIAAGEYWFVVFDGPGDDRLFELSDRTLEIRFSQQIKADELIKDRARFMKSKGRQVIVATSDLELHTESDEVFSAFEFYDRLVSKPRKIVNLDVSPISSTEILNALADKGHINKSFCKSPNLARAVEDILDYFGSSLQNRANKAATQIEKVIRAQIPLVPTPDPEKSVIRTLKKIITES